MRFPTSLLNLRTLFARPSRQSSAGKTTRRRRTSRGLLMEPLETRVVFDAGWATAMQSALVSDMDGDGAGNTYVTGTLSTSTSAATFGNITLASNGFADIFVAKQNASGQFLWAVRAGNPSSGNDRSAGIALDSSGNVFVTGYFDGTAQFGALSLTSAGGSDVFVAKLDGGNGQFLWVQQRGGSGYDRGNAVAIDPSGNLIVAGGFDALDAASSNSNSPVMFVSKFTTDGAELWTRTITGSTASGGLWSITVDAAGDVYAAGKLKGTADFPTETGTVTLSATSSDPLITKLDGAGNWLWARDLPATTGGSVVGTTVGPEGQLYVSGQFEGTVIFDSTSLTSAGSRDLFVARVNAATGSVDWAQRFGGSGMDLGGDVKVDPQGNVDVVGTFRGTADFGPQTLTADGGVENAFVTKLDPLLGTFLETHRIVTGTFYGNINIVVPVAGLHIDAAGNAYVAGWFAGGIVQAPQQPLSGNYGVGYMIKLPPAAATKFFVVDDSFADRTYQYAAGGNLTIDNFSLNTGNTSPRGAASNAAGTTVWVADKNRNVYVYNNSGALQGSWSAGTLSSTAQVEGLATNGTDIWIVDNKTDKVYRYANAASRLSGSQTAASSFALNNGNTNPKGIVTDGTNIWVVNDGSTDKVFKYTVSGSYLGSWTIDSANKTPTGLTIDPSNGSQGIWIVDSGTDRVYQYTNGRSRTSGSQAASAVFGLAVGNTNPQGIADPPPASSLLSSLPAVVGSNGNSLAAGAAAWSVGRATTASLDSNTTNRLSDSQRVVAARRGVDEIMSRLDSHLEPVRSPASGTQTMAIMSRRPFAQRQDVNLELVDGDLNASIDLIAHDLLEMGPSRRGQ